MSYGLDSLKVLHTQEIKKKYSKVEMEIKRRLTEFLLLNNIWNGDNVCRWLSITKNFKIRELSEQENSKYLSNPSTIKSYTLKNTAQRIRQDLIRLIEWGVDDRVIAEKYINWVDDFLDRFRERNIFELVKNGRESPKFLKYLEQSKNSKNLKKQNVKIEIAKILFDKFGDDAFEINPTYNEWKESIIMLSKKSLDYLYILFFNANKVREARWKNLDQVFHYGDFSFVTTNVRWTESDYIDVIVYLVDKKKFNYYWKGGLKGQQEWAKETSQYADILRALTNDQLWISKMDLLKNNSDFQWDDVTKNLFMNWWNLLENIVDMYNYENPSKQLQLSRRLKSLPSCVEKIIEWKKINDTIGFRLSLLWISEQNFDGFKSIIKSRFKMLKAKLEKSSWEYVSKWQTIKIKSVTIDNKWVLESKQLDDIINELSSIVPVEKRMSSPSPYISLEQWKKKMDKYYPEIVSDGQKWEILKSFYDKISMGKTRWRNWEYKDFKFNIIFEVGDEQWNCIWQKTMEVQFDDVNNGKWLSNYNIRNFERWVNTQSRLSFSVPMFEVRNSCEKNLKMMLLWAKTWWNDSSETDFFDITFDDWTVINISKFAKRNNRNSGDLDLAIVKIINYFLKKGTFVLCDNWNWSDFKMKKELLTTKDLHNLKTMDNLHVCSSLELAAQQHSYLQQWLDRKVWIYLPEKKEIWWISMGELIDPMNLWKKKNKLYYVN